MTRIVAAGMPGVTRTAMAITIGPASSRRRARSHIRSGRRSVRRAPIMITTMTATRIDRLRALGW